MKNEKFNFTFLGLPVKFPSMFYFLFFNYFPSFPVSGSRFHSPARLHNYHLCATTGPHIYFKYRLSLARAHTDQQVRRAHKQAAWPHTMCTSQIWLRPRVCHTADSSPPCTPCRPDTHNSTCVCACAKADQREKKERE